MYKFVEHVRKRKRRHATMRRCDATRRPSFPYGDAPCRSRHAPF